MKYILYSPQKSKYPLCILVDFPIQINAIRIGWSISFLMGNRTVFPNSYVFLCLFAAYNVLNGPTCEILVLIVYVQNPP